MFKNDGDQVPFVVSQNTGTMLVLSDRTGYPVAADGPDGLWLLDTPHPWGRCDRSDPRRQSLDLRFSGQMEDAETGLHHSHHRYYDPDLGRFITPDPLGIEASHNVFAYPADPVNQFDPSGLATVSTHSCAGQPAANKKTDAPDTMPRDCNESRGSSIHNDCLNMMKDEAKQKGYTTRSDQMQEQGSGRANRPDLALELGGKRVYVEYDYAPGSRVQKHKNDICGNDPGATIILIELPQTARYTTTTSGAKPSKPGSISRASGPSKADCGIDKVNAQGLI